MILTGEYIDFFEQLFKMILILVDYKLISVQKITTIDVISKVLKELENIFIEIKPDMVLIYGHTTMSLAISFASYFKKIPIGHLDAGRDIKLL